GAYRWERFDLIVLPPSFPFGGMEHPRLTFATPTILAGDRSLTSLVAHELAHSWSGNLVTNLTWDDFWLNEGFTVYFERRIMEALYGKDYADMLAILGYQDVTHTVAELSKTHPDDTHLKLDLKGRNPDDGLTDIAYEKGYFFLRMLEEQVGRESFDAFLKAYFNDNAFKSMDTEGFVEHLQTALLGGDAERLAALKVKDWIYGPGIPDNCPEVPSVRFEQVQAALDGWNNGQAAGELNTAEWSTHEWLYFLRGLPESLETAKLTELDEAFGFTQSGNSEVLAAWFQNTIRNNYSAADGAVEQFLIDVGRRKFLTPTYQALIEADSTKERARAIYAKARPGYHAVSYNTMDALLDWETN
ncbi:MAG: leukotriene A4 hydrolase C-terminal domain-containing protein, partial [Bacteroidota bacterium]